MYKAGNNLCICHPILIWSKHTKLQMKGLIMHVYYRLEMLAFGKTVLLSYEKTKTKHNNNFQDAGRTHVREIIVASMCYFDLLSKHSPETATRMTESEFTTSLQPCSLQSQNKTDGQKKIKYKSTTPHLPQLVNYDLYPFNVGTASGFAKILGQGGPENRPIKTCGIVVSLFWQMSMALLEMV